MTPNPTKKIAEMKDEVIKSPTPTKKEWCGHIHAVGRRWKIAINFSLELWVPDDWTRCPICGKERPKG